MSARTDLCGGRSAMIVPTATSPKSADTRLSRFLGSGRITGKPEVTPVDRATLPYNATGARYRLRGVLVIWISPVTRETMPIAPVSKK